MKNIPGPGYLRQLLGILWQLLRWTALILPVSLVTGSLVALFLTLLTLVIHFRFAHSWIIYLLPAAGLVIHFIYRSIGHSSEKGNDLIIEQIHDNSGKVPPQMAPIILATTLITQLFGGSVGREGTAIQMGAGIASFFASILRVSKREVKIMLIAGIAAGFAAVFGTPVTAAIFALEVLSIGKIEYNALIPALIAAVLANLTVAAWQVVHSRLQIAAYRYSPGYVTSLLHFDTVLLLKVIFSGALFGLTGYLFALLIHGTKNIFTGLFHKPWMVPVCGGIVIILFTWLLGKPDYLGLGTVAQYPGAVTINSSFNAGGAHTWSWLWKSTYTALTLGTGFKGGEITPLFYIGASLGNTLSSLLDTPVSLFAALGFIGVFAGATNTPIACTFMGVELFGGEHIVFFAVTCITAYIFSGHTGIYGTQRIAVPKLDNGYIERKISRYRIK